MPVGGQLANNALKTKAKDRQGWVDFLRGSAIILVVHFHMVGSIYSKFPATEELLRDVTNHMAPFRMPVPPSGRIVVTL